MTIEKSQLVTYVIEMGHHSLSSLKRIILGESFTTLDRLIIQKLFKAIQALRCFVWISS
jgi:hypothetical protein